MPTSGNDSVNSTSDDDQRVQKCIVYGLVVLLALGCATVYSMGAFARVLQLFYLTGYGILSLGYYGMTMMFAMLNRQRVDRIAEADEDDQENAWTPPVSIHVVGYREYSGYFRRCLLSALQLHIRTSVQS